MKSSLKMQQLEVKIADLKSQQQSLIKKRNAETAEIISRVDLHVLDNKILVGGLLHILEVVNTNAPQKEAWQEAGSKFLRGRKSGIKRSFSDEIA